MKYASILSKRMTLKERVLLYAMVNKVSGCWEWTGYLDRHGYGKTHAFGQPEMAHRASWMAHYGEIDKGLFVCHRCDNRKCVNPAHLFLGTAKDNAYDMIKKGRKAAPQVGEKHHSAKLKNEDVYEILRRVKMGQVQRNIAIDFNVAPMVISKIANGKSWTHITGKDNEQANRTI